MKFITIACKKKTYQFWCNSLSLMFNSSWDLRWVLRISVWAYIVESFFRNNLICGFSYFKNRFGFEKTNALLTALAQQELINVAAHVAFPVCPTEYCTITFWKAKIGWFVVFINDALRLKAPPKGSNVRGEGDDRLK